MSKTSGHCLCGAVTYSANGEPHMHVCHCADCRRWTGGPMIGVRFDGGIAITDPGAVNWFSSSDWAERGSCRTCGTTMFYRLKGTDHIIATAGSLDGADAGLAIVEHIFIDAKPPYYDFVGDAPRVTGAEVFARFQSSQS